MVGFKISVSILNRGFWYTEHSVPDTICLQTNLKSQDPDHERKEKTKTKSKKRSAIGGEGGRKEKKNNNNKKE